MDDILEVGIGVPSAKSTRQLPGPRCGGRRRSARTFEEFADGPRARAAARRAEILETHEVRRRTRPPTATSTTSSAAGPARG
jgi:hypothetical protein